MAKYLSYEKLSKTQRAFTSKISHLFVPRNIQEALGDSNWRIAVMEEMTALRKSEIKLKFSFNDIGDCLFSTPIASIMKSL